MTLCCFNSIMSSSFSLHSPPLCADRVFVFWVCLLSAACLSQRGGDFQTPNSWILVAFSVCLRGLLRRSLPSSLPVSPGLNLLLSSLPLFDSLLPSIDPGLSSFSSLPPSDAHFLPSFSIFLPLHRLHLSWFLHSTNPPLPSSLPLSLSPSLPPAFKYINIDLCIVKLLYLLLLFHLLCFSASLSQYTLSLFSPSLSPYLFTSLLPPFSPPSLSTPSFSLKMQNFLPEFGSFCECLIYHAWVLNYKLWVTAPPSANIVCLWERDTGRPRKRERERELTVDGYQVSMLSGEHTEVVRPPSILPQSFVSPCSSAVSYVMKLLVSVMEGRGSYHLFETESSYRVAQVQNSWYIFHLVPRTLWLYEDGRRVLHFLPLYTPIESEIYWGPGLEWDEWQVRWELE